MHFKLFFLLIFFLASGSADAQLLSLSNLDTCKVYTSLEEALRNPNQVVRLKLSRAKLKKFPEEIRQLVNLQELDLSKNKLHTLPDSLGLPYLQRLTLAKNSFEEFPVAICRLTHLKELVLSQNEIQALPSSIGQLKELEYLDLWSNNLGIYPNELSQLTALKELDLRVIQLSESEQKTIASYLPNTKIHFSPSCNCGN